MAKYGKKAGEKVKKAMRERKKGTLRSGRSGKKVTSKKQAIAIGLSQARKAGGKVPSRRSGKSSGGGKKSTSRSRSSSTRGKKTSGHEKTTRRASSSKKKS